MQSVQEEIQKEIDYIVKMVFRDKQSLGHFDLEATELLVRSSIQGVGTILLEEILNHDKGRCQKKTTNGEFKEYRNKRLQTILGEIIVKRAYYYDQDTRTGYCPKDQELDIKGTSFSPGLRRIMARVGAYRPFGIGHDDIKELTGLNVTSKEIQRVSCKLGKDVNKFHEKEIPDNIIPFSSKKTMYICMDGTGVPVVKNETQGRKGKYKDGIAKTREAKLGCVFTQTGVDKKGYPVRDELSTSYVGAIETAEEFGDRLYTEACKRGVERSPKVCVIGDGAPWIWNLSDLHFYGATQIIDIFHAREHLWKIAREIYDTDKEKIKPWMKKRIKELDKGEVEKVVAAFKKLSPADEQSKEILRKEIGYFDRNKERMRYKKFKEQGLFIGSGVIEAGCRAVIGQRLKQSGMRWSVKNANNIIALRCCILSNRWEDFWENRVCA
jgi:hypothetical protein